MKIESIFDEKTFTLTYIVFDEDSLDAVVIDPVLDFDPASCKVTFDSINKVRTFLKAHKLKLRYILETHAHADHLSGAQFLKKDFPLARVAIGEEIKAVQNVFKDVFHLGEEFAPDGRQFDQLLKDEDKLKAGSIEVRIITTPGHTPTCVSYVIGENVFTGDTLFMPDSGTGRCDFPNGSAERLYHSIHEKLYRLPDHYKFYVGHDYQPNSRSLLFQSTIGESKKNNIQLKEFTTREQFILFRKQRDQTLTAPKLLFQSLQININAGHLPKKEGNTPFLKIPLFIRE